MSQLYRVVQEKQCSTVTKDQCSEVQDTECSIVDEEVCKTKSVTNEEEQCQLVTDKGKSLLLNLLDSKFQ